MIRLARKLSVVFAAGCLGGLLNSLAVWWFGAVGVTSALAVKIAPQITVPWLYPRIVWGGIWGALFLLPLFRTRVFTRGLILSSGPTLVQLFIVFPLRAHKGVMGFDLGALTPVFVILFNAIWGVTASFWVRWAGEP